MKPKLGLFALVILVLGAVLLSRTSGRARAQEATPSDDDVNAIASQLYCPVCENTPLDVCPTEACRQWRDLIHQMLAEGKTADEIKQYFVENYGARVLAEPPRAGLNWLVYVVPPVAFLLGAAFLFGHSSSGNARLGLQTSPFRPRSWLPGRDGVKSTDDPYVARLEEELKKRK